MRKSLKYKEVMKYGEQDREGKGRTNGKKNRERKTKTKNAYKEQIERTDWKMNIGHKRGG